MSIVIFSSSFLFSQENNYWQHGRLKVSINKHFLQYEDGTPFFYLADTGWEMLHRLNKEEIDFYLKTRRDQGFNVIQTVILSEFDGLTEPNAYGALPFAGKDHN